MKAFCPVCNQLLDNEKGAFKVVEVEFHAGTIKPFTGKVVDPDAAPGRWGKWSHCTVIGDTLEEITDQVEAWANLHRFDLHFHYSAQVSKALADARKGVAV